jgi:hypothetical protein
MANGHGEIKVYRKLFDAIERESKRVTPDRVMREAVVVRLYAAEKGGGKQTREQEHVIDIDRCKNKVRNA